MAPDQTRSPITPSSSGALAAFGARFEALTGTLPFPWQERLFGLFVGSQFPTCDIPTGLGKTSVIAIWLLALAARAEADSLDGFPRRLVYVVNRRTVVDQATREVERLRSALGAETGSGVLQAVVAALRSLCVVPASGVAARWPRAADAEVLAISTLRGEHADNAKWCRDPSRAAVIVGTVDMIGSRLLFQGYGRGFKSRPLHAAFLGQDALLVHDEAHLEPAFQTLLDDVASEQRRSGDLRPVRVIALSATSRSLGEAFRLNERDRSHRVVRERLFAPKHLRLHQVADENVLAAEVARLALSHKDTHQAIIVFLNRLDDVEQVTKAIQKEGLPCQRLTGTIRGLERDALAKSDRVFARFLPDRDRSAPLEEGTVYLVCTSAGEVGVNISADHLVSDLVPFDRMAQRLGRVNRFGQGRAHVDIVSPPLKQGSGDESKDGKAKMTAAMLETTVLLSQLPEVADGRRDASPAALADLPAEGRRSAFSPQPEIRAVTDILFDAWAFTTARKMPGRPAVAEWLHGVAKWERPETRVAWREDVDVLKDGVCDVDEIEELLDDYPLKPHELLRDRSDRIFKHLETIAARNGSAPVWVIGEDGLTRTTLGTLVDTGGEEIEECTLVLPPAAGGLAFQGEKSLGIFDGSACVDGRMTDYDVADRWGEDRSLRVRVWDEDQAPGMRLVRTIDIRPAVEEEPPVDADAEDGPKHRFRRWYVRPAAAESEGAFEYFDQDLTEHLNLAREYARLMVEKLRLPEPEARAVTFAASWHDLGKRRRQWQHGVGNVRYPSRTLAKSASKRRMPLAERYRHELGSVADVAAEHAGEFSDLDIYAQDLLLHIIAAHHGRARPHFPQEEAFDPERLESVTGAIVTETPRRYGRLQRRFGRWGLAYLESLVRAADALASARHEGER